MNRVTGRVVVKESGAGVADLVVAVYDLDPATKPEETFRAISVEPTVDAWNKLVGSRMGSVLTAADGSFVLEYDDAAFRVVDRERRPDLVLTVSSPEGPDDGPLLLHWSARVRQNAGRSEAFLVRQPLRALQKAGVAAQPSELASAQASAAVDRATLGMIRQVQTKDRLKAFAAAQVQRLRTADLAHADAFARIATTLSLVPEKVRASGSYVADAAQIAAVTDAVVRRSVAKINQGTRLGSLSLSREQLHTLGLSNPDGTARNGTIAPEQLDAILVGAGGHRDVVLERRSPVELACRSASFPEDCGGQASSPTPAVSGAAPTPFDQDTYLARLLSPMAPPEAPFGTTDRASPDDVQAAVDAFHLKGGPADKPAYYDFYQLEIAFEQVWQEAFDAGVIGTAKDAYRQIVELGGSPAVDTAESPADVHHALQNELDWLRFAFIESPPDNVTTAFAVTSEQWNELDLGTRQWLETRADIALAMQGKGQRYDVEPPINDVLADPSHRASLTTVVQGMLDDLARRIDEPYAFTIFAASRKERSVNFGLLVNYRQRWEPLPYQYGKLIKTVPLSPKEVRKYSKKTVTKRSRAEKEVENNLQDRKSEATDTSRLESDIVRKAEAKTNFKMSAEGGVKLEVFSASGSTELDRETGTSSEEAKKSFREAVLKSAEENKNERTVEVNTGDSVDTDAEESGEISNPNEELPVTFLFYELQRRFRVDEQIHRVVPVVLVAQEVPAPDEITDTWLVANDWILRRVILDDSFLPALTYIATGLAGDQLALDELRTNVLQRRDLVNAIRDEVVEYQKQTGQRYAALETALAQEANAQGGGTDGLLGKVHDFFLGSSGDGVAAAKTRENAAADAAERAARAEKDRRDRLEREVTALSAATETYTKALAEQVNRKVQVDRLRLHIKQNILYYMQAIWSHEPSDQRYFRLHQTKVPALTGSLSFKAVSNPAQPMFPHLNLTTMQVTASATLDPQPTVTLADIADLDTPLGFKGNYMVFPQRQLNDLTRYMVTPYLDPVLGLRDPAGDSWTLSDFAKYVCCLKNKLTTDAFTALRPQLQALYEAIQPPDEVIVPTGQLSIEALPGTRPILEDYKLLHRALDVKKVAAEVRFAELENLRAASRLSHGERSDPKVDETIVVEGTAGVVVGTGTGGAPGGGTPGGGTGGTP